MALALLLLGERVLLVVLDCGCCLVRLVVDFGRGGGFAGGEGLCLDEGGAGAGEGSEGREGAGCGVEEGAGGHVGWFVVVV